MMGENRGGYTSLSMAAINILYIGTGRFTITSHVPYFVVYIIFSDLFSMNITLHHINT